jgi:hypothetical protein
MATRKGDVQTYKSKTRQFQRDAMAKEAAFNDPLTQVGILGKTVYDTIQPMSKFADKINEYKESKKIKEVPNSMLDEYNKGTGLFDSDAADAAALQYESDKNLPEKLKDLDDYNSISKTGGVNIDGENVELGYGNQSLINSYDKKPVEKRFTPYENISYEGISDAATKILIGNTIPEGSLGGFGDSPTPTAEMIKDNPRKYYNTEYDPRPDFLGFLNPKKLFQPGGYRGKLGETNNE